MSRPRPGSGIAGRAMCRMAGAARDMGRRAAGTALGLAARLDPREWAVRHRHADLYALVAFLALGTAGLAAPGAPGVPAAVLSLPPFAFMLLVLIRAYRASVAQRLEDASEIARAHSLARQCLGSLETVARLLPGLSGDGRVGLALGSISSKVGLLVTRYGRYLDEDAVWAAMEAESIVLMTALSGREGIEGRLLAVARLVRIVDRGIVGVDHRRLKYPRDRI